MRYVSRIKTKNGSCVNAFEYMLSDGHSCDISFAELEDGSNDILGHGVNYRSSSGLYVCHTKRTATLHQYVNIAYTRYDITPIRYRQADRCLLRGDKCDFNSPDHSILEIDARTDIIAAHGQAGSVMTWETGSRKRIMTLYDMLSKLCIRVGMNVMSYETVQLYSNRELWQTVIRLIHGVDADRFFTKMFVDAISHYKRRSIMG